MTPLSSPILPNKNGGRKNILCTRVQAGSLKLMTDARLPETQFLAMFPWQNE